MVSENEKNGDAQTENTTFSKPRKRVGKRYIAFAIVAVAIIIIASVAIVSNKPEVKGTQSATASVTNVNITSIAIPLSSISQTATWFDYNISGSMVRFFAVKDSNGTIHTAFDECAMCYSSHLGFRQNGTEMIENCCNMSFPIDQITEQGCSGKGCCPIFLPSKVVGDNLTFEKSDLAKQRFVFLKTDETSNVKSVNMTYVAIPLSSISNNATWYQYNVSGALVRFFAVKDVTGTIHTAFDECPYCYSSHLGFRQDGTVMVENCCNMPFAIENITEAGCSINDCHPIFLRSTIVGDNLIIAKSDLAQQRFIFLRTDESAQVHSVNLTHVAIPLSSVSENATWYQYEISGSTVRFFAVKDTNGTIHTAFDECWMCYSSHLGYRQNGTFMVENCCNMPFAIDQITATGCSGMGCHPVFLANKIIGDQVVIAESDLAAGAYLFA